MGRGCVIYTPWGHGKDFGFYSKPLEASKLKSDVIKCVLKDHCCTGDQMWVGKLE